VEGATTSRVFETYVKRLLAPALRPGQVVVMDNLGANRPRRVREFIEGRGCELLYLPPYSPVLNPIEEALSKVKHFLRKTCVCTKQNTSIVGRPPMLSRLPFVSRVHACALNWRRDQEVALWLETQFATQFFHGSKFNNQ
jgi:transposase